MLVGGNSRRMGHDKALIGVDGIAMAQRGIDALFGAGAERVAVVGARPAHARLGGEHLSDLEAGGGPLGGVLTALNWAPRFPLVTLPCDLPGITPESIITLLGALTVDADVALAAVDGRSSLLAGAWNRSAGTALRAVFEHGDRSMAAATAKLDVVESDVGAAFRDVDAPGEFEANRYRVEMSPVPHIDIDELVSMHPDAVILDVREPDEYTAGHVPGALLIPLGELRYRLLEIPEADPLVVICRSGVRSLRACELLAEQGREVVNVAGGILAWTDAGHGVEAGMERG